MLIRGFGVEGFFEKRARANHKPISGLESPREHMEVYSGLSDRQGEAILLPTFLPHDAKSSGESQMMAAWRRGDADVLARGVHQAFAKFLAFRERYWRQGIAIGFRKSRTT